MQVDEGDVATSSPNVRRYPGELTGAVKALRSVIRGGES